MTDIFEHWKKNRFILASKDLVDDGVNLIVLSDYRYWADHTDELTAWCKNRNAELQGMTVAIKDDATLTEFLLKWS
jgi:hypothetical protein